MGGGQDAATRPTVCRKISLTRLIKPQTSIVLRNPAKPHSFLRLTGTGRPREGGGVWLSVPPPQILWGDGLSRSRSWSPGHLLRLPSALTQPSLPPLSVQFVGRQCCLTGQKRLLLSSCAWPAFGCGLDDSGWEFMYYCLERVIFFTATQPILPL